MMGLAVGTRIWIVAGMTDLRSRFTGLSGMVVSVRFLPSTKDAIGGARFAAVC
ncbi:MAG TPA: hypothetical protein VK829_16225 [Terriglobales bacterium]|jgi:hypothetical protein|nr:hypothetical protein [Terriglobales bacterium]